MTDDPRKRAERLLAHSPFAMPKAAALQHIETRRQQLLATPAPLLPPEPNFTAPVPIPIIDVIDAPEKFGRDFWKKRPPPGPDDEPPKPKPRRPRGRKPVGDLPPGADRFRVIDGDGDKRK